MKLIKPNSSYNTINILPRSYDKNGVTVVRFTEQQSREVVEVIPTNIQWVKNNLSITLETPFAKPDQRYRFDVINKISEEAKAFKERVEVENGSLEAISCVGSEFGYDDPYLIYRGLALVTIFDNEDYTINNDEFKTYTGDDSDPIKVYE